MKNKDYIYDPYWITGFTDAEGCFFAALKKDNRYKVGYQIQLGFQIGLHNKDKALLEEIKLFFNCGETYYYNNKNIGRFTVRSLNSINNIIIPHFEKYPLLTQKHADFLLWKSIVNIMHKKEHLDLKGFTKILNIKASLNKDNGNKWIVNFPKIIRIKRPLVVLPSNINYFWLAGFFSGDGCFYIKTWKNKESKTVYRVGLQVFVTQHIKEKLLFKKLINILGYGKIFDYRKDNAITLNISNFKDIYEKVIPIFKKHEIRGLKSKDFKDFSKAAEIINSKKHLTKEGLEEIKIIKSRMNSSRFNK